MLQTCLAELLNCSNLPLCSNSRLVLKLEDDRGGEGTLREPPDLEESKMYIEIHVILRPERVYIIGRKKIEICIFMKQKFVRSSTNDWSRTFDDACSC